MNLNLATIQIITDIQPIPDADAIEVASVMGWKCVVKKGEFKIGDKCVYIGIDTIVPETPQFEFLRKAHYRIKTIRLRKQLSQGIIFPLTIIQNQQEWVEGQDVTEIVNVRKYEKPIPINLAGIIKGNFPSYIPKTDEIMLQSILSVLNEIKDKEVYITVKCDGTSATFVNHDNEVHVCSRNLSLKETEDNVYWKMYHKYHLENMPPEFAVQGEICGPGIQKNKLELTEQELFVFDIYNINQGKYLNYFEMVDFCKNYNLQTVPLIQVCKFDYTLEQLLEMAKGKYPNGQNREGIVIRPVNESYSKIIDKKYGRQGRMSFKVLNNDYLEKDDD